MVFDTNQWKSYADLQLRLLQDDRRAGRGVPAAQRAEPDVQWERLAAAVIGLIERLGVRLTVSVHGIPMAVPHTRPITADCARHRPVAGARATAAGSTGWRCRPASPALLEFRLGQLDRKAMGFAAHVPHYLAQAAFPRRR